MPPPTATGWTNSRYSLSRIETGRLDGEARAPHPHVSAYGFLERGQLCAQVTAHHRRARARLLRLGDRPPARRLKTPPQPVRGGGRRPTRAPGTRDAAMSTSTAWRARL